MERDFLTILVIIVVILLAVLVIYRVFTFFTKNNGPALRPSSPSSKEKGFEQQFLEMEDPAKKEQRLRQAEKEATTRKNKVITPQVTQEQKKQANQEYRELMEKSKSDLKAFREKQEDVIKISPLI